MIDGMIFVIVVVLIAVHLPEIARRARVFLARRQFERVVSAWQSEADSQLREVQRAADDAAGVESLNEMTFDARHPPRREC